MTSIELIDFIISHKVTSRILYLLILFHMVARLSAQTSDQSISGMVRDATSNTQLEKAHIILVGTTRGCSTNDKGEFIITGVSKNTCIIQASMTGYKTEQKKITLKNNIYNEVDFMLQPQTYRIDSVNINAIMETSNLMAKPTTEILSLVPSISKVDHNTIVRQGAITAIDAMNFIPGGLTETRGRQVKQFFSFRGQKYPYPNFALNGVWQKEFEELPYFFSASDIEEIEIVRSSASLLTGPGGMGGLINIKTREYNSPETDIELEYGSFNSIHSHLSNGNKIGNFSYAAGVGYDRSDGPEGKHAKENMINFYSRLNWHPSAKINLDANLFYLDGARQITIAELPADKKYRDMIQNFDPYRSLLSNVKLIYRPGEKVSSELQIFYSKRTPVFHDEVKSTSSDEKDYEWGANFMQSVSVSGSNILRFGGLYNRWIAPNGKRFYTGKRCDTETLSGVLVDEQRIGKVTIDAGLRLTRTYYNDYAAFNIEGEGSQFKNVTAVQDEWEPAVLQGNIGATYKLNEKSAVYFNSSVGEVRPREGTLNNEFERPSDETRLKFDLGLVKKFGNSGKITLTGFGVVQNNAIALNGSVYTDPLTGMIREFYINRDQNQWGMEFEIISPRIFGFIEPYFNLTLMKSRMENLGIQVINKENPGVVAAGGFYAKKKGFDLNLSCKYISRFENERFASITDGPQPLGDFFTIDIKGGYTTKGKSPINAYIRVRNITNVKYSTVVGYPDFGRTLYAGIQFHFRESQ